MNVPAIVLDLGSLFLILHLLMFLSLFGPDEESHKIVDSTGLMELTTGACTRTNEIQQFSKQILNSPS